MKALFLAMSTAGYGETLIGLSLAGQIRKAGVEVQFIVDSRSAPLLSGREFPFTVLEASMGRFAQLLIDSVIREFKPDLIVLSDYFTYCGVFAKLYKIDPWFIEQYGLPIIPIDIWEWDSTPMKVDVFVDKFMPVNERILQMPATLRPSPLCHFPAPTGSKHYPFSLREGNEKISRRTREHLRSVYSLSRTDKLVLLAFAKWQLPQFSDDDGNRIAAATPDLLVQYLKTLPSDVHFVSVGERIPALEQLPAERMHFLPSCAQSRFNVLLGSVDLFLTLNLGATTMTRAVMGGVPSLALSNRHTLLTPEAAEEHAAGNQDVGPIAAAWLKKNAPIYPFRMWPLGFHKFLDPLLSNNEYTSTFEQVELFEGERVVRTIHDLLFNAGRIEGLLAAQESYVGKLKTLDTAAAFSAMTETIGLKAL
jgi:Family of unknown function (DUF6365)